MQICTKTEVNNSRSLCLWQWGCKYFFRDKAVFRLFFFLRALWGLQLRYQACNFYCHQIYLMHDDVTRPKGSLVVVNTLKPVMLEVGKIVKVRDLWSIWKLKQIARAANRRPSHMRTHVSITAIYISQTSTMHVRAAKALSYVTMYKVHSDYDELWAAQTCYVNELPAHWVCR